MSVTEVYFPNLVFNRLIHVEDVCGVAVRGVLARAPPALVFLTNEIIASKIFYCLSIWLVQFVEMFHQILNRG